MPQITLNFEDSELEMIKNYADSKFMRHTSYLKNLVLSSIEDSLKTALENYLQEINNIIDAAYKLKQGTISKLEKFKLETIFKLNNIDLKDIDAQAKFLNNLIDRKSIIQDWLKKDDAAKNYRLKKINNDFQNYLETSNNKFLEVLKK